MKKFPFILSLLLLLAACGSDRSNQVVRMAGNLYPPDYVEIPSAPFNILVNSRALWETVDSQADYRTFRISYPDYQAEGYFNYVMLDSARLVPTMERFLRVMELRSDTICEIDEARTPSGLRRWIFIHPAGKEQIQWMATDSSTMYVAGRIHFAAACDSTVDITPALDNIRADVIHLVDNLRP